MRLRIAVVGARGFIGSAIARHARERGDEVLEVSHDALPSGNLGVAIYCSGVAWGAERAPLEAYRQHVAGVLPLLEPGRCDRLIYLSSTRVYDRAASTSETADVSLSSANASDTYALSKLAGESAVLGSSAEHKVVRCSNVYGASFRSGLFLSDILRQAAQTGRIEIRTSRDSAKDYVAVDDVARAALEVAGSSKERIYNVAAGRNTTHGALLDSIAAAMPVEISVAPGAPTQVAAQIETGRIQAEFPFRPRDVVADLPGLVEAFRAAFRAKLA